MSAKKVLILVFFLTLFPSLIFSQSTIVSKYGALSVKGNYIIGQYGDTVQLRGMSLFWSQWKGAFYNPKGIEWLRDDWKCTIIRAAMGVEEGGYLLNKAMEQEKVERVVKAAINLGIYVIIDYHSHHAHSNPKPAIQFFAKMAQKYGKYPNVLYEIYNEPLKDISWADDIKPYAEKVIKTIRQYDPDNIVLCGTRQWSQLVAEASLNPLSDSNTAYTLHFYAASHKAALREQAERALKNGIALFVSEFGTCEYTGDGKLDSISTKEWWRFLDKHKISWCNWAISDKEETASALYLGANWGGHWKDRQITPSGKLVQNELILKNAPIFRTLKTDKE